MRYVHALTHMEEVNRAAHDRWRHRCDRSRATLGKEISRVKRTNDEPRAADRGVDRLSTAHSNFLRASRLLCTRHYSNKRIVERAKTEKNARLGYTRARTRLRTTLL